MRISDVAQSTGTTARLLRYYEEQGLLGPRRDASGYRDYSEDDVRSARHIRELLDAGLGTATIRTVLPCLTERSGGLAPVCQRTMADLRREQTRIEDAIAALTSSREAIHAVISAGPAPNADA